MSQAFSASSQAWVNIPPFRNEDAPDQGTDSENIPPASQWYWSDDAGHFLVTNGKRFKERPTRLHHVELSWITFVLGKDVQTWNVQLYHATLKYLEGLRKYAAEKPGVFLVPLGKKYRGMSISQCRDKKWLTWVSRFIKGKPQYELFAIAAKAWLDNPRKYEVMRDIGERTDDYLDLADYYKDVEFDADSPIYAEDSYQTGDGFVVDDNEPIEYTEGSRSSSEDRSNSESNNSTEEAADEDGEGAGDIARKNIPTANTYTKEPESVSDSEGSTSDSPVEVLSRKAALQALRQSRAEKRKREGTPIDSLEKGGPSSGKTPSSPAGSQIARRTKRSRYKYVIIDD